MALQGKRSAVNFHDDEDEEMEAFDDRVSTIIPSHVTRTQLRSLDPEHLYMIEVHLQDLSTRV